MDNIRNPFAPGAGNRPPELSGRSQLIDNTDVAIQRIARKVRFYEDNRYFEYNYGSLEIPWDVVGD